MREETELTLTEHHQIQNDATGLCLHHEGPSTRIALYDCMETTQKGIFRMFAKFSINLEADAPSTVPMRMLLNMETSNCFQSSAPTEAQERGARGLITMSCPGWVGNPKRKGVARNKAQNFSANITGPRYGDDLPVNLRVNRNGNQIPTETLVEADVAIILDAAHDQDKVIDHENIWP